jgi:mono/diheme cytochrome c family protein
LKIGTLLFGMTMGLLAAAAAGLAVAWHPEIPPLSTAPHDFDRALVARGESLADIGNCLGCHTADGGRPYAGGRGLATSFGTVHATNITPDPETGIGLWSSEAFRRAMREGVDRKGEHLYPAFPYDHFTRASDADLDALYAFVMTRTPVAARTPANRMEEPFGFRPLIGAWNLFYLEKGPLPDDPSKPADWNRGRALVEGLAHCGGCHTPRNALGAEQRDHAYDGAWAEGWYAPPLNAKSPAVQPWTADALFSYLRTGLSKTHAAAAGPMGRVTRSLAQAREDEVRAMAVYVASLMADAPAARAASAPRENAVDPAHAEAAALFAGACANCHEPGAPMMLEGRPSLAWGTALHEAMPHDTVQIVVHGLKSPAGRSGPVMPAFGETFSDRQIADITAYLRARYTDKRPWPDLAATVARIRKERGE